MQGYGTADDSGRPVTPQTPFALASLSKSFTALAVMQLVEAGQVELDAPVQQYLPWFRTADASASAQITVRHLLHHTSGFSELEGYARHYEDNGPDTIETSIRKLRTSTLNHLPGETFEYSNTNYDTLGVLVEAVSGQPYGVYVEEHIFDPLQMRNGYTTMATAQANGATSGYYPLFGWTINYDAWMPYAQATRPAAGLWASVEDMAHYLIAHLNEGRYGETAVISPAGMAILHTPGVTISDDVQLQEDFIARHGRRLQLVLVLILLLGLVWSIREMRRIPPGRPRLHWIVLPLAVEIALAVYLLGWRFEGWTNLRLHLLGDAPDVGLMFLIIIAFTLGWGPLRTFLLWRNRQ